MMALPLTGRGPTGEPLGLAPVGLPRQPTTRCSPGRQSWQCWPPGRRGRGARPAVKDSVDVRRVARPEHLHAEPPSAWLPAHPPGHACTAGVPRADVQVRHQRVTQANRSLHVLGALGRQ
jgi:hypothetical protein